MRPFSINIPILNEEEILAPNIEKLISYANQLNTEYEILIVSNGSTDRSDQIGKELETKYSQVRYFSLPKRGVGRAFRLAAKESRFDHLISLDIDLTTDLSFVKEANQLLEGNVMVVGSKIAGSQKRSIVRKIGSGIYIFFTQLFFRLSIQDFSIGAKGFQRRFVLANIDHIDDYTSYVLNLAYLANKNKEKIREIPVKCVDLRKSRFNLFAEALYRFYMLFRLALGANRRSK
jgi:glycosyltransferase involved in cell wall biosynthesis